MTNITRKQYSGKELVQVFGGSNVLVKYYVKTVCDDNITNEYVITCKVRGLESGFAELEVVKIRAATNNRSTLIAEAIAELCGWECGLDVKTETLEIDPPADAA